MGGHMSNRKQKRVCPWRVLFVVGFCLSSLAPECGGDLIGDGRTSASSSSEFFESLDTNLDGTVEESEMVQHITDFGGKSLDEPAEVMRSVKQAMSRLDKDKDGSFSMAESSSFWRQLGTVLSVQEVGGVTGG
mmetsp:Transcript_334/g.758  ORF Transcript_334/g.758 Transcript_334/m.758 type:complete len:133 (-) Transcript_334:38-436(-)